MTISSVVSGFFNTLLIRRSTSVAANYRASCLAQSKASFIAKLSVVLEEADESSFYLEFIIDEKIMKHSCQHIDTMDNENNPPVTPL